MFKPHTLTISRVAFCTLRICYSIQKKEQDLIALSNHSDREGSLVFHKQISPDIPLCHCHGNPEVLLSQLVNLMHFVTKER